MGLSPALGVPLCLSLVDYKNLDNIAFFFFFFDRQKMWRDFCKFGHNHLLGLFLVTRLRSCVYQTVVNIPCAYFKHFMEELYESCWLYNLLLNGGHFPFC